MPFSQSESLVRALREAGQADVTLMRLPGVPHALMNDPADAIQINDACEAFFDRTLG